MARDIKIKITGDSSGLKKTFGEAAKDAEGFGSKVGSVFSGIAKAGGALALGGIAAAVPLIKSSIDAAGDFNETLSKTQVLFGDSSNAIVAWADDAARNMGQSRQQAMDAASSLAVFGKTMGFTGQGLADFSKFMVEKSSDMASFFNTEPAEAVEALGAALRGESEPIRKFGVMINEESIKAMALSMGLVKANVDTKKFSTAQEAAQKAARKAAEALKKHGEGSVEYTDAVRDQKQAEEALAEVMAGKVPELTQQQKMLATYGNILDQTSGVVGDFERTSDGLANKQRILTAEFADARQELGSAFLPAAMAVADFLLERVVPALRDVNRWVQDVATTIRTSGWGAGFEQVTGDVKGKLLALGGWLRDTAAPAIWAATQKLAGVLADWVADPAWPWLVEHLGQWLSDFGGWFSSTAFPWLIDKAKGLGKVIGDLAVHAWDYLKDNLPTWLSAFGAWFENTGWPWLVEHVNAWSSAFADWVLDSIPKLVDNLKAWLEQLQHWFEGDANPTAEKGGESVGTSIVHGMGRAGVAFTQQLADWHFKLTIWFTKDMVPAMVKGAGELVWALSKTVGAAGDRLFAEFRAIGVDIVRGVIQGIKDAAGELAGALKEYVWNGIPEVIRKRLGIFSPSKVMASIGGQIAEGLAVGIAAGADQVEKSSQLLAQAAQVGDWPTDPGRFAPTVTRNADGTVMFAGDPNVYPGSSYITVPAAAKATKATLRPVGLGDDESGSYSLSSSGYGAGGGTFNITINGVIIGDKVQLGQFLAGVLRDYDRSIRA